MKQTFVLVSVSVRSDSVMPSTGCILCRLLKNWACRPMENPWTEISLCFFFCAWLWFPCPQTRHHLTHKRLLLSLFQSFILTLMELSAFWRGRQGLIRLRMALKVALSSSGHWREQTAPCHPQLLRDIKTKKHFETPAVLWFSVHNPLKPLAV